MRGWGWVVLAAVWLITIQIRPMLDPDEGRYAEIPREMVASGDWITPRLDGLKYFEKPVLQYWATAALYTVVGLSNWSSRLWTVGLAFACLPLIYGWLARLYDRRAALAAVAILAMSPYFGIVGHLDLLDASFTFWMCAAVLAFALAQCAPRSSREERNGMLVCWATAALAVMTKGIVVFVLAGGALIAYSAVERDIRLWQRLHVALGVPLFLVIAAPWFILVSLRNSDFASFFFVHEHFQRFLTKEAQRVEPWWYFLALLLLGALPWGVALARASWAAWKESSLNSNFKPLKFLLLFSAVTLVFFSISSSKLATYILPIFPLLAAFTGVAVTGRSGFLSRSAAVAAGLALLVAAGLLVYSQHRDGMIPREALEWAIAAAVAALAAVAAGWKLRPWAVAVLFVFIWQALLCEYTVIPPSRSAYALVQEVAPDVNPGTALYSVGQYRQTIPPYLGRTLILVDYRGTGELDFGEDSEPGRQTASFEQFEHAWDASNDAIAFFDPRVWDHYRQQGLPGRVIAQDSSTVAVSRS
jgi:4-amino-4-deoxy-L-arabinose transferase-like glycosyltransferase